MPTLPEVTTDPDPFNLARFVEAQQGIYPLALSELQRGRKQSHWMWFIFPQIRGLGFSEMAKRYAIQSADEARAYLNHPTLGPRLIECAEAVLGVDGRSATQIMGSPDDLKLKSSATLFAAVSTGPSIFDRVLTKYFGGEKDASTVVALNQKKRVT